VTFLGAPLALVGPALAAGAAALVALYLLKLRRRRVEVPFADLWQRVLSETQSTALWKKLRRVVSLVVQLVVLALILFALLDPRLSASQHGRSIVMVIDCSASMQSRDGGASGKSGRTRLQAAKDEARRIVRGLAADDTAMVIAMDARPAPAGGFERPHEDERELVTQIDGLRAADAAADVDRALRLAADALRDRPRPTLVLIGDGAWDPAVLARVRRTKAPAANEIGAIDLSGVDLRYVPVGDSSDNAGITAFAVRRYQANRTAYEVLVEVQSWAKTPKQVTLTLAQDGEIVETQKLDLAPGQRVQRVYPDLAGEGAKLEARLQTNDALPLDDVAFAVMPPRHKLKVLLVSDGDLFLEGALLLDESLQVDKVTPQKYDAALAGKHDAVIFDRADGPLPPSTPAIYVDAPAGAGGFAVGGSIDSPIVTDWATKHPVMRWVTLKDLNIAKSSAFTLGAGETALASALKQPIIVARDRDGHKAMAIGFDIKKSDLPLRVAFPVLIINALDWFAGGDAALVASYATGHAVHLAAPAGARELEVRGPDGIVTHAPVHDGRARFFPERAGFYEVRAPGFSASIAANLADADESRIEPRKTIAVDGGALSPPELGRVGVRRQIWIYLVALALLIAAVEWWTYNRRVTV
jgi:hypothetical protein